MAQYLPFNVKLEEHGSEATAIPQHKPPPPQYTGRRNSALAVARRASMADVLANNARRSGSLGDVLLNASNSAASSLQLYLHSLIQRQGSSPSSAGHDLAEHPEDSSHATSSSSSSSSSSKKSSKRKRKEGKEAKRARKNKGSSTAAQEDDASDTTASRKSKKRLRRSSMSAVASLSPRDGTPPANGRTPGADSECMPLGGSPGAPPMAASLSALSPSSYPSASSSPSMVAAAAAYPPAHAMNGYHQHHHHNHHPAHSQGGHPHQHLQMSGAFTSFDECFDTDLTILSTLSADEVELSPTPLSPSPQPPPAQIGVTAASMQPSHHAYPAAHSAQAVSPSRAMSHHQQQAYQHPMGPPAQPMQMHPQQATSYPTGYPQHQSLHHQPQPLSPPTYHHHHQQHAYPSPVPSPSMTDDWSGLSSLFPQEASWQPRSPALSMHEQVERLLFPSSPFSAPPPASPSSGASVLSPAASTHNSGFLRPHDVPRAHPVSSPLPIGVTAAEEGMMPAASPLSTFFDWADELLAFDPTKQGSGTITHTL